MSTWRYVAVPEDTRGGDRWTVRELYEDDEGEVTGLTASGVAPEGDTLEELADDLRLMLDAITGPDGIYEDKS